MRFMAAVVELALVEMAVVELAVVELVAECPAAALLGDRL